MRDTDFTEESLRETMLSGVPFTYGQLCARSRDGDRSRLIDKTIQKLRRKGLIAFKREGRFSVWRAVPHQEGQP